MNTFTVSFFGHRQIDNPFQVELQLEKIICSLLKRDEYIEFLVGRDGEFDQLVSSTIAVSTIAWFISRILRFHGSIYLLSFNRFKDIRQQKRVSIHSQIRRNKHSM